MGTRHAARRRCAGLGDASGVDESKLYTRLDQLWTGKRQLKRQDPEGVTLQPVSSDYIYKYGVEAQHAHKNRYYIAKYCVTPNNFTI